MQLKTWDRAIGRLSGAGAVVAAVGLTYLTLIIVADVMRRELTGGSIPDVLESSEIVLVITAFAGLGFAQRHKDHVATTLVLDRLGRRARHVAESACFLVLALSTIVLAWWMLQAGFDAIDRGESRAGTYALPTWPARFGLFLGFALMALELVRDTVMTVLGRADVGERDISVAGVI